MEEVDPRKAVLQHGLELVNTLRTDILHSVLEALPGRSLQVLFASEQSWE